eukprot:SAG11_NODE_11141_length_781_cov_1.326979_2_plen_80_part_01
MYGYCSSRLSFVSSSHAGPLQAELFVVVYGPHLWSLVYRPYIYESRYEILAIQSFGDATIEKSISLLCRGGGGTGATLAQ